MIEERMEQRFFAPYTSTLAWRTLRQARELGLQGNRTMSPCCVHNLTTWHLLGQDRSEPRPLGEAKLKDHGFQEMFPDALYLVPLSP